MLHTMARKIAFFLLSEKIITEEQVEVNIYGLELILSTLLNGILVFVFAVTLGVFWQTILMLMPFILIRSTAGGFHAKTHYGCATSFILVYLIGIFALKFAPFEFTKIFMYVSLFVTTAIILTIGIVPHKNRHLSKSEIKIFRLSARLFASFLFVMGLVGMNLQPHLFIYFSLGLFISAGSLLAERIINTK